MARVSGDIFAGGSVVIAVEFTNPDGGQVTPNAITWSLKNSSGEIVNSREDVSVVSPAAEIYITLSGDDLPSISQARELILCVDWTYDSSYGSNLPAKSYCVFEVKDADSVTLR